MKWLWAALPLKIPMEMYTLNGVKTYKEAIIFLPDKPEVREVYLRAGASFFAHKFETKSAAFAEALRAGYYTCNS